MSHGLGSDGDGPGKDEIGEARKRKAGKEVLLIGFKDSSIRKNQLLLQGPEHQPQEHGGTIDRSERNEMGSVLEQ